MCIWKAWKYGEGCNEGQVKSCKGVFEVIMIGNDRVLGYKVVKNYVYFIKDNLTKISIAFPELIVSHSSS